MRTILLENPSKTQCCWIPLSIQALFPSTSCSLARLTLPGVETEDTEGFGAGGWSELDYDFLVFLNAPRCNSQLSLGINFPAWAWSCHLPPRMVPYQHSFVNVGPDYVPVFCGSNQQFAVKIAPTLIKHFLSPFKFTFCLSCRIPSFQKTL